MTLELPLTARTTRKTKTAPPVTSTSALHVPYSVAADWLVRSATPAFLEFAGFRELAARLTGLGEITRSTLTVSDPFPGEAFRLREVCEHLESARLQVAVQIAKQDRMPVVASADCGEMGLLSREFPWLVQVGSAARHAFTHSKIGARAYAACCNIILATIATADYERRMPVVDADLRAVYTHAATALQDRLRIRELAQAGRAVS